MKISKIIPVLAVAVLSSCSWFKKDKDASKEPKPPLQIPTVDVENLSVNLPTKPTYNTGNIRSDENFEYIDLYELSDFHGAVNYKASSDGSAHIGLSKLATYLNNRRSENPGGTVVLSSGDMFQGSAESNLTRGFLVNYSMNYMGFDALAIGNHEFDWTDTWIKKNAELEYNTDTIPFLGANIFDKRTNELATFLKEYTIVERGDYKIGVIGSIGDTLESSILASSIANYEFKEEAPIVESLAEDLKSNKDCDAVVWLTHNGVDAIPSVPTGVDFVFGGHAHTNKTSASLPICATANYGQGIAHATLKFDKTSKNLVGVGSYGVYETRKTDCEGLMDNSDVKSIISQYSPSIDQIKNIRLAHSDNDLLIDGALKGICCKSMFEAAVASTKTILTDIPEDKIIAAVHNVSGGIRSDIAKGEISYGSVFTSFPFDNEIILLRLKGSLIVQNKIDLSSLGAYKKFDSKNELNINEYYYLVATDYLATGILGRDESAMIHTGKVVRDVVAEYMYNLDEINGNDFMRKTEFNNIAF